MRRKRRKIRKLRGSRTCGGGNAKKRRGAGHRGGRGLAGSGKNKKTKAGWVEKEYPGHLGRRGFKRPPKVIEEDTIINLRELDQNIDTYIEQGIASKKGKVVSVNVADLGVTKVLGTGKVTRKLEVFAPKFSQTAIEKIEEMGGTAHASS